MSILCCRYQLVFSRTALSEDFGVAGELHAHHFIDAKRRVIPVDFIGGDVVGMNGGTGFLLSGRGDCEKEKKEGRKSDEPVHKVDAAPRRIRD